jgi:hypothetical protein
VKVDVSGFTVATIEEYLDAALAGDTEPELQVRVTALRDGRALHGQDLVERIRAVLVAHPMTSPTARQPGDDTLDLCAEHRPQADVATRRADFRARRVT